jgi:arsenate reductase-like glutaredoxin family protein
LTDQGRAGALRTVRYRHGEYPGCDPLPTRTAALGSLSSGEDVKWTRKNLTSSLLCPMPRHFYYLGTCTTCARIMKEIPNLKSFTLREIKGDPITAKELDHMKELAGSYEALFSRVALKYRALGLNKMSLTEKDYRRYILQEYTFLKRPVMVLDHRIFIGNAPKVSRAMVEACAALR